MRGLIKRWARDYLYDSGPKNGSPSKIAPDAKTAQGIQPGTGQKIGAEEMNYLLSLLQEGEERQRFTPLFTWTKLSSDGNGLDCAAWSPLNGEAMGEGTSDVVLIPGSGTVAIESASAAVFSGGLRAAATGNDSAGAARAAVIGGMSTGAAARYETGFGTYATTATLALTGGDHDIISAAYDEENGAIVALALDAGSAAADNTFIRFADAGTALSEATSIPSPLPILNGGGGPSRYVACGGGRAMCVYGADYGGFDLRYFSATSTDGGDNWTATATPAGSGGVVVTHLDFVKDFLGLGSRFVCCGFTDSDGFRLYHTTDGAAWTTIVPPTEITDIFETAAGRKSGVTIGDTVLLSIDTSKQLYVWDVQTGKVSRIKVSDFDIEALVFDGLHVYVKDENGTGDVYRSGSVAPLIATSLDRMSG